MIPAGWASGCRIAGKLSGTERERMRAGRPPGSAGVSPAFVSAQPRPSPPPGSTGKPAATLLRPGTRRSCRWGWRVLHRRDTERNPTAVHAGGTPTLPGGLPLPIALAPRGGQPCSAEGAKRPERYLHPGRPANPPRLCFGRARAVPAGGVGGCYIAGILSETQRQCMRAGRPPGSAGVSPAFVSAQHGPSPPPGSTGKPAMTLLRPGTRRSCRRSWRVLHPRILSETQRQCMRAGRPRSRVGCLFPLLLLLEADSPVPRRERSDRSGTSTPGRPANPPRLCFGRARAVPAGGVGGCYIAGILSETQRQCGRAGRPRSRGLTPAGAARRRCPGAGRRGGRLRPGIRWTGSRRNPGAGVRPAGARGPRRLP